MIVFDDILIEKIQKGDKAAFEQLFRNYYGVLCDYARRYVKKKSIAEDQVQEVFVKIWEQRRDWNPQGTIKTYLYKAVRNQSLNYLKHKRVVEDWKRKERLFSNIRLNAADKRGPDIEQLQMWVEQGLDQLPEKRREVYELSRNFGLTYHEIAETLGISVKTVETQMGRSLKHLREWLEERLKK